ncbi:MAG: DUF86 domain-containing protein [bacterium]
MMKKDDTIYLRHILDAIAKIEKYTVGIDYEIFIEDTQIQDSIIRQLEIIGEATKRFSDTFRDKYPHISWKKIAGMRDKLIHDYLGVDTDAIWDTVKDNIPDLREKVALIIEKIETNAGSPLPQTRMRTLLSVR